MTQPAAPQPDHGVRGQTAAETAARLDVRSRHPGDLPALLTILERTHSEEGYPVRAEAVRTDWIASAGELLGAVAVHGKLVLGQIALRPVDDQVSAAALRRWEQATGRGPEGLALVSRFFTDRSVLGAGTLLLTHAEQRAAAMGRVAVLQVDPASAARAFYGRRGWHEVGTAVEQWGHRTVDAVLMVCVESRSPADQ